MELALVFVLQLAGLLLALALGRALIGPTPGASVRRVTDAVRRAIQAFAARALTRAAGVALLAAVALLALGALTGRVDAGLASAGGALLGALLAAASALIAHVAFARASGAVIAAADSRFDQAQSSALRAAGAIGVGSQALAVLGALAMFGAGYWLHASQADAGLRVRAALLALPGYALGAASVAFVLLRTSGVYAAAARHGELHATLGDASLARQEPRNPALVSAIVAAQLERGAGAARLFAASAVACSAALMLEVSGSPDIALASRKAAFPLLLWAFGLVAHGAGLFAARSLEAQGAAPALARGMASAAAVWLFGLLGAGYWLFPEVWPPLAAAAVVGFAGSALGSCAVARATRRQSGPLREALEALRAGAVPAATSGLGFGFAHAALGLLGVGVAALAAARLGVETGLPGGDQSALLLAIFGAMAWSPYAFAVEGSAANADTARRVAGMSLTEPETLQRLQRLVESQLAPSAIARGHAELAVSLGALAACLAAGAGDAGETCASLGWLLLLGAAWILGGLGAAARRAARAARAIGVEVDRQLAIGPSESPGDGRATSYRACEEVAARAGIAGAFGGTLAVFAGPVLLGIALKLVYRDAGPRLAAGAFATFVAGAAVTALGVALTMDGARAVLAGARRANRPEGDPATYAASVTGDALAEILGSAVGPLAGVLALIAAALVLFAKSVFP